MLAMLAASIIWMTVPARVIYRESSQVRTDAYSVEERQCGHSFYITPAQKRKLALVRRGTPVVWFGPPPRI